MNVWIVNPYGTLPKEGWREYRSSMLARAFAARGHHVTWWISNFEHRSKKFRKEAQPKDPALPSHVDIIVVPSTSYTRNISIARIQYEQLFGKGFERIAVGVARPDAIILADPSLFYSAPVMSYANSASTVVILDVMDLWPEQFLVALPVAFRRFGRLLLSPLFSRRQRLVNAVDAVIGVTKDHLRAVKPPSEKPNMVAYLGLDYEKFLVDFERATSRKVQTFTQNSTLVVVYAGTLGEAYDLATLLTAAEAVVTNHEGIKFIFAGDGPCREAVHELAARCPDNVLFLGKVAAEELPSIYRLCHIGICSYSEGSTVTMPIKLYDYIAGGLFVLYSIDGEINDVLAAHSCGAQYTAGRPDELAGLIQRMAQASDLRVSDGGLANLAKEFDSTLQHSRVAIFVEELVRGKQLVP
jgi:glycosyltransferase involved in cell wall biosynthesis